MREKFMSTVRFIFDFLLAFFFVLFVGFSVVAIFKLAILAVR